MGAFGMELFIMEEARSERLINYWRLGLSFFFYAITATISHEIPARSSNALYIASTAYLMFSIWMFFLLRRGKYHASLKYISLFVDVALVTYCIWNFGTYRSVKSMAYLLYFQWIALASIRFSFRMTLMAGLLCMIAFGGVIAAGYILGTFETGTITEEYTTPKVSLLNVLVKLIYLATVTVVLSYGSKHYRKLAASAREQELDAERQRMKAQKLESIGFLAGGIAHDFNNSLAIISNNLYIASLHAGDDTKIQDKLEAARKAAQKASALTQQLLTFSKGGAPVKRVANLKSIVEESSRLAMMGATVRCSLSLPDGLSPVEVDEGQINQVINNLLINAVQASPSGGRIEISAVNTPSPGTADSSEEGRYVRLTIRDHGAGIPPDVLPKIFDPYFTTKEKGSGLGLATCYSIVKRHGGTINVESEPGAGSAFHVYLPASDKPMAKAETTQSVTHAGAWNLLVMDDEEGFRQTMGEWLTMKGHSVTLATDGADALAKFRAASAIGRPFDAVIMDLTIAGGMGGKETVEQLRALDPGIRAIVVSGYSNDPVMADHKSFGFRSVLAKPFSMDQLVEALNNAMHDKKGGAA